MPYFNDFLILASMVALDAILKLLEVPNTMPSGSTQWDLKKL